MNIESAQHNTGGSALIAQPEIINYTIHVCDVQCAQRFVDSVEILAILRNLVGFERLTFAGFLPHLFLHRLLGKCKKTGFHHKEILFEMAAACIFGDARTDDILNLKTHSATGHNLRSNDTRKFVISAVWVFLIGNPEIDTIFIA